MRRNGKPASALFNLKLYREPHSAPWVVYPGVLWGLELPAKTTGQPLVDESGNIRRAITGFIRYSYLVEFEDSPLFAINQRTRLSEEELLNYTDVPQSIKSAEYFTTWVRSLKNDKKHNLSEDLDRIRRHFQERFKPTLDGRLLSLETFLTKDRTGHCEYFATSAALALRLWGYPSRVVLGYRGGSFNRLSQVLEVRDENAHAWTEVFLPGKGWLRFDPTPLVRRTPRYAWLEEWSIWSGAAKYWFSRYVVDYNTRTQTELLLSIGKTGVLKGKRLPKLNGQLIFILVGLCGGLFFLLRWQVRRNKVAKGLFLPDYYLKFQKRMRKLGFQKKKNETYRSFHGRVFDATNSNDVKEIDRRLESDIYAA